MREALGFESPLLCVTVAGVGVMGDRVPRSPTGFDVDLCLPDA